ncbi:MAG: ABC transporter substrate-binding protein [Eubacteriales bacterium]|nr:ABC transporter substrate-binding protein [Eubacteriales bacterium]
MKKKFLAGALAVSMTAALLSACGGSVVEEKPADTQTSAAASGETSGSAAAETPAASGDSVFTYAIAGDTGNTLNPLTADDRFGLMTCKALYAPLYFIHPDGTVDYILAESMEANEDGTEYTCKLKEGLKWSDGEPLTADDVVFTYEAQNENSAALYVNDQPITVEKVDDLTVTFKLPAPSASTFELLSAEIFMLPKHYFEPKGTFDVNILQETPVGCGPYVLDEYMTGQYLKFTKNPYYVLGEGSIDTIVYRVVEKDDTATLALQNGEVDAWISTPDYLTPYENNDQFTINNYSEGRVAYLFLNTTSEKMQDKDYRRGILYSLDRDEIMMAAYTDPQFYELTYTFLPPISEYYNPDVETYARDVDLAKELTANGAKDLTLCYIATDSAQEREALTIQASLKAIGINVELAGVDSAAWTKAYMDKESGDYDMMLGGYIMGIDPNAYAPLFSQDKDNNLRFNAPEIDKLWIEADQTQDKAERKELYDEIQKLIQDEAIFYPFGSNMRSLVLNSRIGGVEEAGLVLIYTFADLSKLTIQ